MILIIRPLFLFLLLSLIFQCTIAQTYSIKDTIQLKEVYVLAKKKIENTGVTRTVIDTIVLRESVCNSLSELLSQNTVIFIKSYGRGSLATASFRGTAPSHTQVTWNGMKLNSPMLGMVDFSLIPSYFIDDMSLWHGASSVNMSDGALGGGITLNNKPSEDKTKLNFIQGIGKCDTYDSYLRINYGNDKLKFSTRLYNAMSDNDFIYINHAQGIFIPVYVKGKVKSQNTNGEYRNTHLLQEIYYTAPKNNYFSFVCWAYQSDRGIPKLSVSFNSPKQNINKQIDENIRAVASWKKLNEKYKILTRAGCSYSNMKYTLTNDIEKKTYTAISSRSTVSNLYSEINADYYVSKDFLLTGKLNYNLYNVDSYEKIKGTGYKRYRNELSTFFASRYKVFNRLGIAYNIRRTFSKDNTTPFIHAILADLLIWSKYNLYIKSSAVRNYHTPTLNDMYFQPGGNPDLKTEEGYTYDAGMEFQIGHKENYIKGDATVYRSDIDNWIIWLPTHYGYWEARNVKKVKGKGIELKLTINKKIKNTTIYFNANWAKNISLNYGDSKIWGDASIGKQLVYVPEFSSGLLTKVTWKDYYLTYKYTYYSERFTTSSNELTDRDRLTAYYMNDVSIGRNIKSKFGEFGLKISVNNLFDEDYESVLKRGMIGRNFTFVFSYKI